MLVLSPLYIRFSGWFTHVCLRIVFSVSRVIIRFAVIAPLVIQY